MFVLLERVCTKSDSTITKSDSTITKTAPIITKRVHFYKKYHSKWIIMKWEEYGIILLSKANEIQIPKTTKPYNKPMDKK